jgi:predicted  nucleic acid-binding Zn-ribbon protein
LTGAGRRESFAAMEASNPSLLQLAETEAAVLALERERVRLPQAIAAAEARAASARETAAQVRTRLETAEKERRTHEAQVQDQSSKRSKFQAQSAVVKTNKEYTTLLHEIETHSGRIAQLEDAILLAMEAIESASEELKQVDATARQTDREVVKETEELRSQLAAVEKRLALRVDERNALLVALGPRVEALYARVMKTRSNGIARIEHAGCSACHRTLPPEVMNRVGAGEVHACASCHCILVPGEARRS